MSKKGKDPWVRMISVTDPVLHKKGYTLYKVTSKVFPKNSIEAVTEVTVWKRYNDFKKLHKALLTIYQNLHLKGTFPPFAKARFFGRFDDSVIEERRMSALELLQFANNYPPLFTSQVFVKFFEDGHSVNDCMLPQSEEKYDNVDCLLPEKLSPAAEIQQSKSYSQSEKSPENELTNSRNALGGTWQHRQVADSISLSSHCTDDEDDRTTFTDDDSTVYRPSLDLSEFDPLLETVNINASLSNPVCNENSISDNWLLSALQSCSNQIAEKDAESILEFPTPFNEVEYGEMATPSNEYPISSNTDSNNETHFSFDLMPSTLKHSSTNDKCSPLTNPDVQDSGETVYNCDDFATTPTALKNENKCQPTFILHASKYVVSAQEAETNSNYLEAFENYKKAIDVLLQGIQKDNFPEIRDAVRKKVLLYLMRAEEIYENKLPKKNDNKFKENVQFAINPSNKISTMQGCIQDLNKYKVLGILGKVLLVLDVSDNKTYVVKTLYKSSIPKTFDVPHIVPQNIPFMTKLYHIYETSYAIFLILEHASGGKLWDYVSSYLQRSPLSPCNEGACLYIEPKQKANPSNVYSGKKVSLREKPDNSINTNSIDSDLTPSENCPPSYVALFRKYAAANKEENVALAQYKKISNVPFTDSEANEIHEKGLSVSETEDSVLTLKSSVCDNEKEEITKSLKSLHKNSRNRLSSSTGSLETALSQKTCLLDAFSALDKAVLNSSARPTHLPESCVYLWAAEIVVALESLHNLGITWVDFHPDNILLGPEGHILLTYQSKWNNVDFFVKESTKENLFCAPEVSNIFPVTVDCDWWSLGAILFELLTGKSVLSCHPTGITRHTILNFPSFVSGEAKDFVSKLLQYNSTERLGSGIYGVEELKSHPFLRSVDWDSLYQS